MTAATKTESTSLARSGADAPKAVATVKEKKAFLEAVQRTDLGKLTPDEQRGLLISYGQHTGLRPEHGEVMIYQGRFYITMAGRIRNAHANGLFDGEESRPVTDLERRNAGYESDDIVWKCKVYRKGASRAFEGWGKVTREEIVKARAGDKSQYTPIARHPVEMARKRALYDAMRNAFPIDEEVSERTARFIVEAEAQITEQRRLAGHAQEAEVIEEELAGRQVVDQARVGDVAGDGEGADDVQLTYEAAVRELTDLPLAQRRKAVMQGALRCELDESDLYAIVRRETGKTKVGDLETPEEVAKVLVAFAQAAADREGDGR